MWKQSAVAAVAALCGGLVATWIGSATRKESQSITEHRVIRSSSPEMSRSRSASRSGEFVVAADHERRLAELEEFTRARQDVAEMAPPSPEEIRRADEDTISRWADELIAFENEPVDVSYVRQVTLPLQRGVTSLGERSNFEVANLECRSSMCRASLRSRTYADALQAAPKLAHESYEVNCAVRVVMPPPSDPEQPYESNVLYRCVPGT